MSLNKLVIFNRKPEELQTELLKILINNRKQLAQILTPKHVYTWENLLQPLEELQAKLHQTWTAIDHANAVANSPKWRNIYQQCLPKVTAYLTEYGQNLALFKALKKLEANRSFNQLNIEQKKVIKNELRDLSLSGVGLPSKDKKQYAKLQTELAQLNHKFAENLLDATQAWSYHTTSLSKLKGIPKLALAAAKKTAKQQKKSGWLFSLEQPSYLAVMTHAENRDLRKEIYTAYVTRASEQGPNAKKFDNTQIIRSILKKRYQLAELLQYKTYADYSLATKMAKNRQQVIRFLTALAKYAKPKAVMELKELQKIAQNRYQIKNIEPWDIAFLSEKLRQEKFAIAEEDVRPYFPQKQVIQGMFRLTERIFKIKLELEKDAATWHNDVQVFAVIDNLHQKTGYLCLDLYARANKRSGAWMTDFISRRKLADGTTELPIAFITANFNQPIGNTPALFTHDEVGTLFHEFGHALQHLLTTVDCLGVSGINGVPWDTVELASQFMENWTWEWSVTKYLSKHYQTKKIMPRKIFNKLLAAKNFQSGLQMLRQIEFSLFDFRLHIKYSDAANEVQKTLDQVRAEIAVLPAVEFNRFQNSFSHIFASSAYAAGYYSYKWAEVLSADAFAKFEEDGLFNQATGLSFLHNILEPGGSIDPQRLFKKFRGRNPKLDALLRHSGIKIKT